MEELINYFKNIESRLAALEAAEQGRSDEEREAAQEQRIAELTALTATLSAKIVALEAKIVSLEARPATVVEKVVEKVVETATETVAETPVADDEYVAIDAETGEPELEVEFIEEPEAPEEPEMPVVPEQPEEPEVPVEQEEPVVAAPATTGSVVPKVQDIRKAITLADRFLFQRELFQNNGELMSKSIDAINALGSLQEAENYIATHFPNWDSESNAYELFSALLKRRF